jgi:periplasmic divalent cation tolerance protein
MMASWLYMTAETRDEAQTIARTLVEERLVSCANILGPMDSIYWWDGVVKAETEVAFIVKTRATLVDQVVARVTELHSYDCPCVVALPINGGNPDYLAWIEAQTNETGKA